MMVAMDKLAAMQVFVKVVETGGLSSAGRALNLAPSSVTRRIRELEDYHGVTLLTRTTRKVSLTEAGETYYEQVKDIVQAVEEADLAVTQKRAEPSGTLRVTTPSSMARRHIAPAVAAFLLQYPKIRVVMRATDRIVDVVEDGLDVALRAGRLEDSSLIGRKIGEARRLLCASPAYLKRKGRPATPEDLASHDCLTHRSHPGSNLWRLRGGSSVSEVQASGPLFAADGETLVAGACAGLGIILAPEWLVGDEVCDGRLDILMPEYVAEPETVPLYAVFAQAAYTPPKVRSFVDFLSGRFARDYNWTQQH